MNGVLSISFPFYRWGGWDLERFCDWLRVTYQIWEGTEIWTWVAFMTTRYLSSENTKARPSPDFCFLLHKMWCALKASVILRVHGSLYFVSVFSWNHHFSGQGEEEMGPCTSMTLSLGLITNKMEDNIVASTQWVPHKVSSWAEQTGAGVSPGPWALALSILSPQMLI